ncbi:hypothetical protein QJS66_06790 [Kocuria rhizophila]|nr:hypothetical protein QJS66_06790 [Kocuria rhizophila]
MRASADPPSGTGHHPGPDPHRVRRPRRHRSRWPTARWSMIGIVGATPVQDAFKRGGREERRHRGVRGLQRLQPAADPRPEERGHRI